MSTPTEKDELADAVDEALDNIEQPNASSADDDDFDPNNVEVLGGTDSIPSIALGDAVAPSDEDSIVLEEPKMSPQDAVLQSMIEAKNEALQALDQTQKEAASMQDRLMRVSAEFENYKKRQARERQDAIKFANEGLLKELLPVLDNFDRALGQMRSEAVDERITKLIEGVEMVENQFTGALAKCGVEGFSSQGEVFDPNLHEAVSSREDTSVPNNTVLEEYQKGYKLNGRLVRPSMVIVSSGGPPPVKPETTSTTSDENA